MKPTPHIGYEIHTLDHTIGKLVLSLKSKLGKDSDLTQMQGWIIGYLYEHTGENIFQKDPFLYCPLHCHRHSKAYGKKRIFDARNRT